MSIALIWTMSRSGIAGFLVASSSLGVYAVRKLRGDARRGLVAGYLLIAALTSLSWKGPGKVVNWYEQTGTLAWRLTLWRDSCAIIGDFWLSGTGLNTYGAATLIYPQTDRLLHAVEAHNDYLQLAVEGGLLVGLPALAAVAIVARRIRRRFVEPQDRQTYWIRAGAVSGLLGVATQEMAEFSLQLPGNAVLFALVAAIAIHRPGSQSHTPRMAS
jgi:O-antigen ligase